MLNKEVLSTLQVITPSSNGVTATLLDYTNDEPLFTFLVTPRSLQYSAETTYIERNPMYGKTPYVRFQYAKATRLSLTLDFFSPGLQYDLSPLVEAIDSLRYPSYETITVDQELPIQPTPAPTPTPTPTPGETPTPTPSPTPTPTPGGLPGEYPGGGFPTVPNNPNNPNNPGGNNPNVPPIFGDVGQFSGIVYEPNIPGQPTPVQPNIPGNGDPTDPLNPDNLDPDLDEEIPDENEQEVELQSIEVTVVKDPPQLSLVFGERVIAPIKLESYTIEEPNNTHINGLPTRMSITLNFIALSNPLFGAPTEPEEPEEPENPNDIGGTQQFFRFRT